MEGILTTRASGNTANDPTRSSLRVPAESTDTQGNDRREAHALEEQRQHQHRQAGIPKRMATY